MEGDEDRQVSEGAGRGPGGHVEAPPSASDCLFCYFHLRRGGKAGSVRRPEVCAHLGVGLHPGSAGPGRGGRRGYWRVLQARALSLQEAEGWGAGAGTVSQIPVSSPEFQECVTRGARACRLREAAVGLSGVRCISTDFPEMYTQCIEQTGHKALH